MKKILVLITVLSVGFVACKKEAVAPAAGPENLTVAHARVVAAGNLFSQKSNTGLAKLYQQKNGSYTLGLEEMNLNAGRSLVVYLSGSKTVSGASLKIFSAPFLYGTVLHRLPLPLDLQFYKYVLIQTEPSEETIATAELK